LHEAFVTAAQQPGNAAKSAKIDEVT